METVSLRLQSFIDCLRFYNETAVDMAIEDTLYKLGKDFQRGKMNLQAYIKKVRQLATKQMYNNAILNGRKDVTVISRVKLFEDCLWKPWIASLFHLFGIQS